MLNDQDKDFSEGPFSRRFWIKVVFSELKKRVVEVVVLVGSNRQPLIYLES